MLTLRAAGTLTAYMTVEVRSLILVIFRRGVRIDVSPSLRVPLWTDGTIVEVEMPLSVSLRYEGRPLDFTYADFDMPIATCPVSDLLAAVGGNDIQRFPVIIGKTINKFDIINVITKINCIDRNRSYIEWWEEGNDIRPDLAGTPKLVTELVIDPRLVRGHQLFRPQGWEMRIIASDVVKNAFEESHVTGIRFRKVSP